MTFRNGSRATGVDVGQWSAWKSRKQPASKYFHISGMHNEGFTQGSILVKILPNPEVYGQSK